MQLGSLRLNSQLNRWKGLGFSRGDGFLAEVFVVLIVWTFVVEVIAFSSEIVVGLVLILLVVVVLGALVVFRRVVVLRVVV